MVLLLVMTLAYTNSLDAGLVKYCTKNPIVHDHALHVFGDRKYEDQKRLEKLEANLKTVEARLQSMVQETASSQFDSENCKI